MNADELREAMRALPEPPAGSRPPHWNYWRRDLWERVVGGEDPRCFPSWPCIYHTMLVNHWKAHVALEFDYIFTDLGRWVNPIAMGPPGIVKDRYADTPHSMNLIHQAYYLKRWENATGKRVKDCRKIIEFGGGYGAMALVVHRLGFGGEYAIYDLPEFALLQRFYLGEAGVKGVAWNKHDRRRKTDLLVGCYSLSEMPLNERREFLAENRAKSCLFLYSARFVDYDNLAFFQGELPELVDLEWEHFPAECLPEGNWYTIGR